jgi:protease II
MATASDGTKIPISLVSRKTRRARDGSAPMLLYAYGSYGVSVPPAFLGRPPARCSIAGSSMRIAHIRGGGELGEPMARCRAHDEQDQHVHDFHCVRRIPHRAEVHVARIVW